MGDESYQQAVKDKRMSLIGPSALTRNVQSWLADSVFAGIPPAKHI
jgi:hypothetical protein